MSENNMKKYVGNNSQLFDVRQYTLTDGRSNGTRAISIWNGGNLSFTVIPDRCLDIAEVRYKGKSMAYITPSGIVNPKYFDPHGSSWLRSFGGGFLTTCGLQNIGTADGTEDLTMHGRISNIPCENVCVDKTSDGLSVSIKGTANEASLFGCKLSLTREYRCSYNNDKIYFKDIITNNAFERIPVSVLYHMNVGYPLLSEKAKLVIPSDEIIPRDSYAKENISSWNEITEPKHAFREMCYYHKLKENCYGIDNPEIGTSMRISFKSNGMIDRIVQWRMFGECEYVLGLEAASCTIDGHRDAVNNGSQKYLDQGESFTNEFCISFESI